MEKTHKTHPFGQTSCILYSFKFAKALSSSSYPLEVIFCKIPFRTIPEKCHHRASVLSGALRPTDTTDVGVAGTFPHDIEMPPPRPVRRPTSSSAIFHRRGGFRGSSSDGGAAPVAADAPRPAAAWRRRGDDIGRPAGPIRCTYLVTGTRHYPWLILFGDAVRKRESIEDEREGTLTVSRTCAD